MSEEKKNPQSQEEPSLSELLQIRRAKLKELQDAGAVSYTHLGGPFAGGKI